MKQAVCALVMHETGLVLSVSRKDSFELFGLPGGKVDPGETLADAAVRELHEETGLKVYAKRGPIYSAVCHGEVDYDTHTFLCGVLGRISTTESGLVRWVSRELLCSPERSPFYRYNRGLFEALDRAESRLVQRFTTEIPLEAS